MSTQSATQSTPSFSADDGNIVPGSSPLEDIEMGIAVGVARLRLAHFRCYPAADLKLDGKKSVVLTGPNGAGKTNLLEAVSYLAPGRGLRGARLGDVTRTQAADQETWAVAATVIDGTGMETELGTGLDPVSAGGAGARRERRVVRINGEAAGGPSALANRMRLSWITPQMDRLFTEAPSGRRRFLDRLVYGFDPGHARRVGAYERALRERNKVLREYGTHADAAWLSVLEHTLAEQGIAIAAARRETIARLRGAIAAGVGPFPGAEITIRGQTEEWLDHMAAVDAEDRMAEHLRDCRHADANLSGTGTGPHKSDFIVRHRAKDMPADLCSTGEQKALLIAIVLADAGVHTGMGHGSPILLLDEVAAHLDRERRLALFEQLAGLDAQIWLTGTDRELFRPLDGKAEFFTVEDGQVTVEGDGPGPGR